MWYLRVVFGAADDPGFEKKWFLNIASNWVSD